MYKFVITFVFLLCFSPIVNAYAYNSFEYQSSQNLITQEIFSDYFNAVKSKLQKNWIVPDFLENGHTRIIFKLDREGYVLSARIAESSGNKLYDESALYALRNAEPFGKFPESATKEVLTINYSFDSELVKTKKMREYVELADKDFYLKNYSKALNDINLAILEVQGDEKSYYLYERRAKIKQALGDFNGAKADFEKFQEMKYKVDIKRAHFVKHFAEVDNSPFAYFYLAYCYETINDYKNALDAINKAISLTEYNNQYKIYKNELIIKNNKQNQ